MLGHDLSRTFLRNLSGGTVLAFGRDRLDITNPRQIFDVLREFRPALVINCAAYTNVDGAETERAQARALNVDGPSHLAGACAELDMALVHFSTDQVFDGSRETPRQETDPVNPLNYYAQSKLEGEQAVLAFPENLVLRVQWLYGEKKDRFTPLRSKEVFTPFSDQIGAPTWTRFLSEQVLELVKRRASGLFHFSYDDSASWAEVYGLVVQELGLSTRLEPKKTSEVSLPAKRPLYSVLSNRKLAEFLGRKGMGSWKESMREFLHSQRV